MVKILRWPIHIHRTVSSMNRAIIAVTVLGASLTTAVSATFQPLAVKTGLWQMAATATWAGLPPQLQSAFGGRSHSYQSCVTPADLKTNPWANGSEEHCTWTVLSATATDMEVKGTSCDLGKDFGMSAEVHGKIHVVDPTDGTGTFDITLTGNGQTITGHTSYIGKWVSANCPTD